MRERKHNYYLPSFILPFIQAPPDKVKFKSRYKLSAKEKKYIELDGDNIKVNSIRLNVFKEKGLTCVFCGIQGKFFIKEKTGGVKEQYHLELYAVDENGVERLMTKDHIHPVAKGGTDDLNNLQPACEKCNSKKGDTIFKSREISTIEV